MKDAAFVPMKNDALLGSPDSNSQTLLLSIFLMKCCDAKVFVEEIMHIFHWFIGSFGPVSRVKNCCILNNIGVHKLKVYAGTQCCIETNPYWSALGKALL